MMSKRSAAMTIFILRGLSGFLEGLAVVVMAERVGRNLGNPLPLKSFFLLYKHVLTSSNGHWCNSFWLFNEFQLSWISVGRSLSQWV